MNVYLIGGSNEDYRDACVGLEANGHKVFHHDLRLIKPTRTEMRPVLHSLIACDGVCLMDDWWSSAVGNMLQTMAAWLKMRVLDADGNALPTSSLRG